MKMIADFGTQIRHRFSVMPGRIYSPCLKRIVNTRVIKKQKFHFRRISFQQKVLLFLTWNILVATFKDGLAKYYIVYPNICILNSFKFLANKLDMHFTWTHCICTYILMYIRRLIKVQHIHLVNSIHALTWHSKSSARVLHIKYLFMFSLGFWQQTLFL